jgi:hypothetical protein
MDQQERQERLLRARGVAMEYARNNGTVDSRSIRPRLAELGLLGGDERFIGSIFRSRQFRR